MDFAELKATAKVGDEIKVSNGHAKPKDDETVAFRVWFSHNFTGKIVEIGRSSVAAETENSLGNPVRYELTASGADQFEIIGG